MDYTKKELKFFKKNFELAIMLYQHLFDMVIQNVDTYIELENLIENNKITKQIDKSHLKLFGIDRIGNDYLGVLGELHELESYSYFDEGDRKITKSERKQLIKEINEILKEYKKMSLEEYIEQYH